MLDAITLEKAIIKKKHDRSWKFTVLFNPSEYVLERAAQYAEHVVPGLDKPITQFIGGACDTLRMSLFFDTYSTGPEVGGNVEQKLMFTVTSTAPELLKKDVSQYTKKVYELMNVDGETHTPPIVIFEWGSFTFEGYVVEVSQQFTKFTFTGVPVRAKLDVTFKSQISPKDQRLFEPRFSPDRTKFFTLSEGDTLTEIAEREYGDAELWRLIADANQIENPRLLRTGDKIEVPALL